MSGAEMLRETEAYLHAAIPITRAMGVQVDACDEVTGGVVLAAPMGVNHNHLGTAFGGSLSALCTLGGYVLLWMELQASGESSKAHVHVVVKESHISYVRPVKGDEEGRIRIVATRPEAGVMEVFRRQFLERGRASVEVACHVEEAGQRCVDFRGMYVAVGTKA